MAFVDFQHAKQTRFVCARLKLSRFGSLFLYQDVLPSLRNVRHLQLHAPTPETSPELDDPEGVVYLRPEAFVPRSRLQSTSKNLLDPNAAAIVRRASDVSILSNGSSPKPQKFLVESKRNSVCFESRIKIENEPETAPLVAGSEEDLAKKPVEIVETVVDEYEETETAEEHAEVPTEEDHEAPSLIRANLLGPLSFDDLYYT
ncbi:hypothetical protein L596_028160 [Steinernema carpocapsae]|uniref:Uncharacterized protein n=1 Tax=Steinernema carpocapsae TaxID=34508 RepID=A0A4V5ZXT4_STECR|nr:hypothetical protein L596_028160 [Steinernema carpocapsae]